MNRISTRLMRGLLLALALCATPVLADDDCAVPMANWQPREAVVKLAADQGWALRRIRIDDGCYVVIGRDAQGRAIEVKLDPASLAVIEMEFEDDHEHHEEDRTDQRDDESDD